MENICVFGAGSRRVDEEYYREAYKLGKYLAQNGYGVVFGGGNSGIMGCVARGAKDNNGFIRGVAPEFMNVSGVLFDQCDELILTQTMRERKETMEAVSDAFIALPGGVGTFEELFEVLTLKILGLHKKAVIIMNTNGFFDLFLQLIQQNIQNKFTPAECLGAFSVADSPKAVIEQLDEYEFIDITPKWLSYKEE